jgi:UTP:GlnB (protein PII) uridylyltransferase
VPGYTVMTVEASDRLALLHDVLQALADCTLDVAQAFVDTSNQIARDIFHITDLNGNPIAHQSQIGLIRDRVLAAIA